MDNIIGSDPKFREIVKECLKVAKTDIPVLLTGETGTGKEVMAKALHRIYQAQGVAAVRLVLVANNVPEEVIAQIIAQLGGE